MLLIYEIALQYYYYAMKFPVIELPHSKSILN